MTTPDRIKVPAIFWLGMDRLNIRRSELLRAARLPVMAGHDDAIMTTAQFFALWHGLEILKGPDVGLAMSTGLHGSNMPPSFLAAYYARDLGDALARVARFKTLCAPEEMRIEVKGEACHVTIRWLHAPDAVPEALTDATMAALLDLAVTGTGMAIRPLQMKRRGAPNPFTTAHFQCPIHWHSDADCITFHATDLGCEFGSYNNDLLALLDQGLLQLDKLQVSATLTDQVRWLLRRNLTAGRPELSSIAQELSMSQRSLQRHLSEQGHSFQSLLSDVRHKLARDYLTQPSHEIAEIAYMLGYNDHGSFYRAFRKWEGKPPAEWRATQSAP